MSKAPDFGIQVTEDEGARSSARKVDERFRPVFDAVKALDIDGGKAITATFESEDDANAAKGTAQVLAGDEFTVREKRGARVVAADGATTITLTKRPKQTRTPKGDAAQEVAPAE